MVLEIISGCIVIAEIFRVILTERAKKVEYARNKQRIDYWHNKSVEQVSDFDKLLILIEHSASKKELLEFVKLLKESSLYTKYTTGLFTDNNVIIWSNALGFFNGRVNEEIAILIEIFLERINKRSGKDVRNVEKLAMKILNSYKKSNIKK